MKKLLTVMLSTLLLLSACNTETSNKSEKQDKLELFYGQSVSNEGEAVPEARLQYGLSSDTPFAGTLNNLWYTGNPDYVVLSFIFDTLYAADESRTFIQGETDQAPAWYEMSDDLKTKTIHVNEGVKWHDGEELTADDIIFAMYVLADPDYTGVRFTSPHDNIVGAQDYKDGNADEVAGIKKIDEYTLSIEYNSATEDYLYASEYFLPEHIFKDIPVADMATSDAVRKNPIGTGPFMVNTIVPGEAVTYDAFEDYYQGAPKIAGVDLKVVNPNVINEALKAGEFDMVSSYPTAEFDESNLGNNVKIVQQVDPSYNYLSFKLGYWDNEQNKNVVDPDMKMADVNLRKAMGHSVDYAEIAAGQYNNLRMRANSIIVPTFTKYYNEDLVGYDFRPDYSEELLDEAGYEDVDGDGFREDPNGDELVINLASMSGGASSEDFANFFIQSWQEIGLNVQLTDGRLIEFNSFYELLGNDDESIDAFLGAWGTGYNPNPTGLYSETAQYNFSRYTDDEINDLIERINSEDALFDDELRVELYDEWQELVYEKAHAIPILYRTAILPINNRVKNYNLVYGNLPPATRIFEIELTEEEPIKAD